MDNLFARDDILWEKVFLEYKFKYRILEYNTGYSNIFLCFCLWLCTVLYTAHPQYVQTAENVILRSIEKWAAVQWQVGRRGSRESWNSCNKNARLIMTTFKIIVNYFRQEHCVRATRSFLFVWHSRVTASYITVSATPCYMFVGHWCTGVFVGHPVHILIWLRYICLSSRAHINLTLDVLYLSGIPCTY